MFVSPHFEMTASLYSQLVLKGYRRSGELVYRPRCNRCCACVPVRIPVQDFEPSRTQRRGLRKNTDLTTNISTHQFDDEHYDLYVRYIQARHGDGSMAVSTPDDFSNFLSSAWSDTVSLEFRLSGNLICVAVTDILDGALSSVYTYFDPRLPGRSLGTNAILSQIDHAREHDMGWLYLGFWIRGCRKMAYKNQYRPIEAYLNDSWQRYDKSESMLLLSD